jgi:hypothetical protein
MKALKFDLAIDRKTAIGLLQEHMFDGNNNGSLWCRQGGYWTTVALDTLLHHKSYNHIELRFREHGG